MGGKKSPTEQYQIEIYRNREQSEETSKSSFKNSVQHNPTACTFTQKLPTMAWVAQLFKGEFTQPPTAESLCVDTPACSSFVSLSFFPSADLQIKSLP